MKKIMNTSFIYAILGMVAGVFYREFTKILDYTGDTVLGVIHVHLLTLGMVFFLIVLLIEKNFSVSKSKHYNKFYAIYNGGLALTVVMFLVRGVTQVLGTEMSKGLNASISGFSGIGHALIGIGLVLFFLSLKEQISKIEN